MSQLRPFKRRRPINRVPILIVEDDADQWLLIRTALDRCFPEVEPVWVNHATLVIPYLDKATHDPAKLPQLILLDLYLPSPEEGWFVVATIKRHPVYKAIPLIMVSPSQVASNLIRSYSLGIASYTLKPVSYPQWQAYFYTFRRYWWECVRLAGSVVDASCLVAGKASP